MPRSQHLNLYIVMRFLARHITILTLAIFFCALQAIVRGQSKTANPGQGGTVTGTVTIKGRPAAGVVVGLQSTQPSSSSPGMFKSKTEHDGTYRITDIPSGTYEVSLSVPGYVLSGEGVRDTTVVITAGETVNGIDFALVRGGVITGKVTDADGKPVIEEHVMLTEADPPANRRQFYPLFTATTDDRGIYRMFGVPAGRYKVLIGRSDDGFSPINGRTVYKQTYHPDVSDPARASAVEVTEGSEASDINIAVGRPTPTFSISGRVVDSETNNPVPKVQFGIQTIGERRAAYVGRGNWSNARGEFKIDGLMPGKYGLFLAGPGESNLRAEPVSVDVVDQDIVGLVIKTSKAATVLGTVVLEDPDNKVGRAKLAKVELQFFVQPTEQSTFRMARNATINADGTFRITGLESGLAYVGLRTRDGEEVKGLTVARIIRDGITQPRGLEIKPGEDITDIQIMVSYGTASVHGTVKLSKGALTPSSRLWIQITRLGDVNMGVQPPDLDARGQFLVEGLSRGTYIFTVYMQEAGGKFQPRLKQQVNVSDGSTNEVTLTIDLDAPPLSNPQ